MAEKEIEMRIDGGDVTDEAVDYIETIQKLKDSTVSKDKYQKLQEENKKLLNSLVNGESLNPEKVKEPVDVDALRSKLYSKDSDLSNLDYISTTLELRKALIERGERDPFLSSKYEQSDVEKAERVAQVLTECVEEAEGNSAMFTALLQDRTIDSMPMSFKRKK